MSAAGYELISRSEEFPNRDMVELAREGSDNIALSGLIRFIKITFNYEYWDFYTLTVSHLLPQLDVS